MGNNKVKTISQMQGKTGNGKKDLHPKSRRVKQAARVDLRTKRVNDGKKERLRIEGEQINRLLYFVREMDPSKEALTKSELHDLARRFLARLDYEITKEQKERRQGRPKSKRHEELDAVKAREQIEYDTEGLVLLDLTDKDSVASARHWNDNLNGKSGYLTRLRTIRIYSGDEERIDVVQEGQKLGEQLKLSDAQKAGKRKKQEKKKARRQPKERIDGRLSSDDDSSDSDDEGSEGMAED